LGGFDPSYGRNREDILRQSSVSGWDGGIFAVEAGPSTRRLPESHWAKYSLGWRDEMIYYDFAKSLAPETPVFDPELHTITSVYHISPLGVSPDYFRTTLWMEHLHGLGAHLLWWWGRNEDGTPRFGEFLGGLLTQPQLLDAWGRTVLELRRLTPYVALFPQLERRVRILYSEPTAIHDPKDYPIQVRDAYEALYFQDYPVGFVTERMVREGCLARCALLVIPGAKYVNDDTVARIREYRDKGGRIAVTGKEPLQYDEYGKPREAADFRSAKHALAGSTPEQYAPQLDKLMDEVGIRRPVRAAGKDGKPVWGVELRAARKDNKWIVALVNVTKEPVEIVLKAPADAGPGRDLVANRPIAPGPLTLEPRKPMLVELVR
jgi:beta-galactosidase